MEENIKNKRAKTIAITFLMLLIIVFLAVCIAIISTKKQNSKKDNTKLNSVSNSDNKNIENSNGKNNKKEASNKIYVVPTLLDNIDSNSAWCATFQLVWNDMQNKVVKQDIKFNPQLDIVKNLNEQSFKEEDISSSYYYKTYGLMTKELKAKIEKGIKDKFNQESDILDKFNWDDVPQSDDGYSEEYKQYFFYTMLYKEFNFEKEFSDLKTDIFTGNNEEYKNIEYFGIDKDSSELLYKQVDVLYYKTDKNYAVSLKTKEGDNVVLCMGDEGTSYEEVWENINKAKNSYRGKKKFTEDDTLKVPNIEFDVLREFKEIENESGNDSSKIFYDSEGNECYISKALQSIKFSLDKSGGKIKSEAGIAMQDAMSAMPEEKEYRHFNFDKSFTMFLVEDGKSLPYFATTIDNITLYQ